MVHWCSLYLPCAKLNSEVARETVSKRVRDRVRQLGYEAYDPFAAMPAQAYSHAVKLFVAPVRDGWMRILGAPEEETIDVMADIAYRAFGDETFPMCLLMAITEQIGGQPRLDVIVNGAKHDSLVSLMPYIRPHFATDDLRRALSDSIDAVLPVGKGDSAAKPTAIGGIPTDLLPKEMRDAAKSVNPGQASALSARLGANLLGKAGGANSGDAAQSAARKLLQGNSVNWESDPAARRLRAVAQVITLPDTWRTPDYIPVRDAYQLQIRKSRNPSMSLLPGDAEAMAAVKDAITYTPIFAGKN